MVAKSIESIRLGDGVTIIKKRSRAIASLCDSSQFE